MRVPTYDTLEVERASTPAVQVNTIASTDTFSQGAQNNAALARGVGQFGEALRKQEEQDDLEKVQIADAAYKQQFLDWRMQAREKYKGVNADHLLPDFEEWHRKTTSDIDAQLGNERQRKLFSLGAAKNANLGRSEFGTFVLAEKAGTRRGAYEATTQLEIDNAAMTANPTEVEVRRGNLLANLDAYAASEGIAKDGPEYTALRTRQLSGFHAARVNFLVDQNYQQATEYWKENKGEVQDARTRDAVERVLKQGGIKQAGFEFANREDIQKLSEQDAITAARDAFSDDPAKRENAIHEIRSRFAEQRAAREARQKDASDTAWRVFADTGRLSAVPSSVLAEMDGRDLEALKRHAQEAASGTKVKTDPTVYYDLRTMAAQQPEKFKELDLRRYFGSLDEADREKFINLQQEVKKGDRGPATWEQQKSQRHNEMGFAAGDREKKGTFDRIADEAFQEETKRLGRKPTYEEGQKILDRLMIQGDVNGWLPGGTRRYFQVLDTEEAAKFVPEIAEADRQAISDRYRYLKGRKPTDAELVDAYRKWKGL